MFLAIGCSNVATWGGGAPGADESEGATAQWGVSTVGVSSTSENHPSHHKYKSPNQFELKQSCNAQRAFTAR